MMMYIRVGSGVGRLGQHVLWHDLFPFVFLVWICLSTRERPPRCGTPARSTVATRTTAHGKKGKLFRMGARILSHGLPIQVTQQRHCLSELWVASAVWQNVHCHLIIFGRGHLCDRDGLACFLFLIDCHICWEFLVSYSGGQWRRYHNLRGSDTGTRPFRV